MEVEKDWITAAGLRGVVIMTSMGHRCGYVGVPENHPLYGVRYSQSSAFLLPLDEDASIGKRSLLSMLLVEPDRMTSPELVFDVHGSVTYSGNGEGKYPVESNLWWFGFDCAHLGDASESTIMWGFDDGVFRSTKYCIKECERLADQIVSRTIL